VSDHVVLVGYDAERTPRMIAELVADDPTRDVVLVASQELDVDSPTHRYVRAASLTAPADLRRAGIAEASRVIVYAGSDAETLATTLAVTALNDRGHVVCFLQDGDTARLLRAHCPTVEIVMTPTVELMVKALSDPGSTRLLAQLTSHTDEGATLYVIAADAEGSFDEVGARLRGAGAVLIASCPADETTPRFDMAARIRAGDRLFYVARERLAERVAA
jgi:voltage-gated potassium channel